MKKKILTTAILLTGLTFASTYHYTFKISDTSLFKESQQVSNGPTMQDATPQERTGVTSTGVILASDGGVDWYGEVSAANLISGDDLATLIDLTAGNSINSNAGWLHVALDGQELFIAKLPLRNTVTWNNLNDINAVYGNRIVPIKGNDYKIRLLKGANSDNIASVTWGFDISISHGSEWNRILYRLTNNNYRDVRNFKNSEESFIHLAYYSESELVLDYTVGQGSYQWCQESISSSRVNRGHSGVSLFWYSKPTNTNTNYGWRPVLEKVN